MSRMTPLNNFSNKQRQMIGGNVNQSSLAYSMMGAVVEQNIKQAAAEKPLTVEQIEKEKAKKAARLK